MIERRRKKKLKLGILKINEVRALLVRNNIYLGSAALLADQTLNNVAIHIRNNIYLGIRRTLSWDIYWDIKRTLLMRRNETW